MEKMLRANVVNHDTEIEQNVITKKEQIAHYKQLHPLYYPHVKENFLKHLKKGEFILVNSKGGWCTQSENIKIVNFITN